VRKAWAFGATITPSSLNPRRGEHRACSQWALPAGLPAQLADLHPPLRTSRLLRDIGRIGYSRGPRRTLSTCSASPSSAIFALPASTLEAAQAFLVGSPLHGAWYAAAAFFATNGAILAASASASLKLILLLASVSWMVSTGRLPENTASVLSKVGFSLIIPCMLMSKVASTLSVEASLAMAGVPLAAFLQICVGGLVGWLTAAFVVGDYSENLRVFGYHPNDPSPAAAAIAASTAAAMSVPTVGCLMSCIIYPACLWPPLPTFNTPPFRCQGSA